MVMKIIKGYKFRMYPNFKQIELINKTFGCTRLIYNTMLDKKLKNNKLTCYDLIKEIPSLYKEYEFLKEVDSMSLRCAVFDLDNGFKKYYRKETDKPKFKKKGVKSSYRTNYVKSEYKGHVYENIKIDLEKREITLPKLKEVKIRGYRNLKEIKGRIINTTVERKARKYYVSVCVEEEIEEKRYEKESIVGIDVGIKNLVVTSDGEYYGNPRYLDRYERKIKGLQKWLSRKEKGSNNYKKVKIKIEEAYRKMENARRKTNEEIVSKLVKRNTIIVTETLKVKEMIEKGNKRLRKNILNSAFKDIIRRLEYKCKWNNVELIKVNEYYKSSQICNRCGNIERKMKNLNIRKYKCTKCKEEIERDVNASINIMYEGLRLKYKLSY